MSSSTLVQQLPHTATAKQGSGRSVPCQASVTSQMWCTEPSSPSLPLPQVNRTTTTAIGNNNKPTQDALSISKRGLQDIRDQLGSEKRNRQHSVLTSGRISTIMGKREGYRLYRTPGGPPLPGLDPITLSMGSATCASLKNGSSCSGQRGPASTRGQKFFHIVFTKNLNSLRTLNL